MRLNAYLVFGAVSGALSAAAVFLPLGEAPAPKLFGYCFGIDAPQPRCDGIELAFYLMPGLIFGVAFAGLAAWRGRLRLPGAIVIVTAASIGNALATAICVGLFVPFGAVMGLGPDISIGLIGALSGAVGGGLLGGAAKLVCGARVRRPIAAAAGLGLLIPVVPNWPVAGCFVFYIVWQAGYAASLAASLPAKA